MRIGVVRVGNSRGVRIPKVVLEECGVLDAVDLEIVDRKIVLTPAPRAIRKGWAEAAERMARLREDALLIADVLPDDPELPW